MERINEFNKDVEQLKATTRDLAIRNNKLERLLNGMEFNETSFRDGLNSQRINKMSIENGLQRGDWQTVSLANSSSIVTQIVAGTGISVSPVSGLGVVTVTNTGVTQIVAGTLITINPVGGTGAVTINGTAELPSGGTDGQLLQRDATGAAVWGWGRMKTI